jgi:hypothetical protein
MEALAGMLRLEKTTTEAVSSDILNILFPLKRNKTTSHSASKVAEGQENPEEAV